MDGRLSLRRFGEGGVFQQCKRVMKELQRLGLKMSAIFYFEA